MSLNVENLVRSGVILVIGLPLTFAVVTSTNKDTRTASTQVETELKANLVEGCVDFMVSKPDSKLERQGQDKIDVVLGADGAAYKELCNWVL